jgi:hypothetical protein
MMFEYFIDYWIILLRIASRTVKLLTGNVIGKPVTGSARYTSCKPAQ